ncbi:unnamed protein product [marine sediment metagenome]|uniref:Uncharacterized protein n=1 Tax=marine sediment metagenome TaxID=412755 RepID=X1SYJ9_9ZZZZ
MKHVSTSAGGFELYVDAFNKAAFGGCGFRLIHDRLARFALKLAWSLYR